ncbi:hypothetical protein BDV95DRAFT_615176 [Massariosphaeria phaeospora]|uniref:Uncharacterized protein n=1 Tax=Massariosphaeria phaeospora TaxID=100035 RepID=A0A7C8MGU1_9PLEO|nr:hypothetical protein BDV95DRAFT_615176 [Massariosphaeria phaeospora]
MDWETVVNEEEMGGMGAKYQFDMGDTWPILGREKMWASESRRRADDDAAADVRKAFDEYDRDWDRRQDASHDLGFQKSKLHFPTRSGNPSDLLSEDARYLPDVRDRHLTHHVPKTDFLVKYNVYGFLLSAFSMPIRYIPPPYSFYQAPNPLEVRIDFSGVDMLQVKELRDHLLRKEMMRWHPDKLGRFLEGEGSHVVSADGALQMSERQVGLGVDQAVRQLKGECEEALRRGT